MVRYRTKNEKPAFFSLRVIVEGKGTKVYKKFRNTKQSGKMPFRPYFSSVSAVYSHYAKILLFGTEKLGTEIKLYTDSKEPN